jgi:hypothetical protein
MVILFNECGISNRKEITTNKKGSDKRRTFLYCNYLKDLRPIKIDLLSTYFFSKSVAVGKISPNVPILLFFLL